MHEAGQPKSLLYDNLEGKRGEGDGKWVQDGRDTHTHTNTHTHTHTHTHMADLHFGNAKTITIL